MWGGVGEQKQSGNESQWRRIHFLVPASVGPSPLLSRLSLTRMMAHVYTHEPHARTYFWSGIRKEHCETSAIPATVSSTTREGVFLLFFPPSLSFPLSPAHACLELSRPENLRFFFSFFFFTNERGSLRTFRRGTVKRHRDLGQRTFNVSDLYILFFENYLAWIAIKQYERSMYYRLENRVGVYKNRKRFLSIK